MSNEKHYPLHPNQSHPPIMTCEIPLEEYESIKRENAELKAKLESVQATAYTESVDAGMENRKLKRALWTARAKAYRYIAELITCFNPDYVRNRKMFIPNNQKQKQMNSLEWARLMLKVESKCRAKAEEYR